MSNKDKIFEDPSYIFKHAYLEKKFWYSDLPIPRVKPIDKWDYHLKKENEYILKSEQNSLFYRCDEFIKQHNGKHLLFLGCSYTFGNGVLMEEIWSKKIFNKINERQTCSGYFSLGYPGSSLISQITLAFKYFKNFGNPNAIFLNVPDVSRFYFDFKDYFSEAFYPKDTELLELISYQYYFMLEQYCNHNDIQLFSTSWAYAEKELGELMENIKSLENFDSFYKYDPKSAIFFAEEFHKINNSEYDLVSRDGNHLGIGYHEYWSNVLYGKYKDKNNIRD